MKKSESIATLAAALTKAQAEIKNAPKSGTNPHFKNKYVPLDEMIPVCKEALNANGISFIQGAEQSESGDVLHLSTMLLHTSGEWIESTLTMKPVKADPQGIGSCITYARRYSLAAICGVASEEDDDGNAASQPAKPASKTAQAAPARSQYSSAAHEEFIKTWVKLPDKKRNDVSYCANFLPLVAKWEDVYDQTEAALKEAIDKLNLVLSEQ